ncbi:MAG: efflux RND transporter periplasmic adaptor subunit [Methylococcales bacterium]
MIKRMIIMLSIVGIILTGIFGFISFKGRMIKQFMSAQGEPLQTVSTTTAEFLEWSPKLEAVGNIQAIQGINVSAEVAGIVDEIYFKQGDTVKAGTPLLQLRAYDDKAKLESLKAAVQLAQVTYHRDQAQYEVNAISKQTLDIDKANLDMANANAAQQQALLNKKLIRAPFTGQLGIRQVDVGQYLEAGAAICTLQSLDTVFADFYLPQQLLGSLKLGQPINLKSDTYPAQTFTGEITVINPKVELNTRNVRLRATLKNPQNKLLPGMYVTVNITTGTANSFITLPRAALTFNTFGSSVYRIEKNGADEKGLPKLIAKQSIVITGDMRGDQVAILSGINAGDTIVTAGQIKLHNGSPVAVDNSIQPSNQANPQPIDQ